MRSLSLPVAAQAGDAPAAPLPFQELLFTMPITAFSEQPPASHTGRDHPLASVSAGSYSHWIHLQNPLHLLQWEQGCFKHFRKPSLCSYNFMSKCESGDGFNPACSVPHLDAKPVLARSRSPLCIARGSVAAFLRRPTRICNTPKNMLNFLSTRSVSAGSCHQMQSLCTAAGGAHPTQTPRLYPSMVQQHGMSARGTAQHEPWRQRPDRLA